MDRRMSTWSQPLCRTCFAVLHPGRVPVQVLYTDAERCCLCGTSTDEGIFVRIDPATVTYPRPEEN
jgi:hypothetical protein